MSTIKQFTYKVYSKSGTFKGILKNVMNDFGYTAQINSGQGDVEIDLKTNFGNTTYVQGDTLKVYVSSDLYPSGLHIYSGIISKIKRTYQGGIEKVTLVVLGLFSKLNDENHSLVFTGADPSAMIGSIIDSFNTLQSGYVSKGSISSYGGTQSITFDKKSYLSSLQDIGDLTPTYWWYCDKLGKVNYLPYGISNDFAVLGNNVENISVEEDAEKIVNFVEVKTNVGIVSSQSNASIASYGRKAAFLTRTDLPDNASGLKFAQEYIAKFKDPVKKIRITLNDKFKFSLGSLWRSKSIWSETDIWGMQTRTAGIEELEPGMNISVRNIDYTIYNLQIQKIEYNQLKVVVDLSYFDSFTKEVLG